MSATPVLELPPELQPLHALLEEHAALEAELVGLAGRAVDWQRDVSKLLRGGNMDDDKAVATITALQTKLDMVPGRRAALEAELAGKLAELDAAWRRALAAVWPRVEQAHGRVVAEVAKAIRPFCDSAARAEELALETDIGQRASFILSRVRQVTDETGARAIARRLLELWQQAAPLVNGKL